MDCLVFIYWLFSYLYYSDLCLSYLAYIIFDDMLKTHSII
jgi:hypothetical protein